jgi:hypothetical protein
MPSPFKLILTAALATAFLSLLAKSRRRDKSVLTTRNVFVGHLYNDLCHEQFVIFGGTNVDREFAEEVLLDDMFLEQFSNHPTKIRRAYPQEVRRYTQYAQGRDSIDVGPILLLSQRWEIP